MSESLRKAVVRHVLPHVKEPASYIGGEWNQVNKDHAAVDLKVCLAFPDTYAIGMSHTGLHILYGTINRRPDAVAERVFAPWPDMAQMLRARGLPLYSLESFTPLCEFDILGFSLQYEMSFTNVLTMLQLGGLPLRAADRGPADTLVIAGGPCALMPEPMAEFIDLFVVGDGEEVIHRLLDAFRSARATHLQTRTDLLREVVRRCPHVYAPVLYEVVYAADGRVDCVRPRFPDVPPRIEAAVVADLNQAYYPDRPIVPYVEIVHDRITLEIMRGCPHRCRYCSAGWTRTPLRLRSVERLVELAESSYRHTGYSEISLAALSSCDYPHLGDLVARLNERFALRGVNLSLPSLRVDRKVVNLPPLLSVVRRSGLTLAPEAGTERLRAVLGKQVSDEALFNGIEEAYRAGWTHVKLYFMVGLPTERDEDIEAIVRLVLQAAALGRKSPRGRGGLNVTVAPFVPKAHTPFQWEAMAPVERLEEIRRRLHDRLRGVSRRAGQHVVPKVHRIERSLLEAVFSRGDRRLAQVVHQAWKSGCQFDAWDEYFDFGKWLSAFREAGLDPDFYAHRQRGQHEALPWDHLSAGTSREQLWQERERAMAAAG